MRITASRIHDGYRFLPEGSVLELTNEGVIVGVSDHMTEDTRRYEGLICPGFVNAHCHLELSHLKGKIAERTGLIPFLKQIPGLRSKFSDEEKKKARTDAYQELIDNGVVAIGDIANTSDALDLRAEDKLHFHSFIECLGFNDNLATDCFAGAIETYKAYMAQQPGSKILRQSLTPHAPYSVSTRLFELINEHQPGALISVHNQESAEEDRFFQTGAGEFNELLNALGIDSSRFIPSGKSSLKTYMNWLAPGHPVLLVHNTYTRREDVLAAQARFHNLYWCLCPNANLYIEGTLPDVEMMISEGLNLCIGTDSLASNHQLSIYAELCILKEHFQALDWEILLHWATLGGAKALGMEQAIGSFEPGKKPGVLNIVGEKVSVVS